MKQTDESDLARDTHLSFKIIELSQNILNERVGETEMSKETKRVKEVDMKKATLDPSKSNIAEPLFSS